MPDQVCDILIVGGGVAGLSLAWRLSERASVHVVEMEEQPGFHSTGRSAALFVENYGNATIRALSKASRSFLFSPPDAFATSPLTKARAVLVVAQKDQRAALANYAAAETAAGGMELVDVARALEMCPILRSESLAGAVLGPDCADIEVHELLQSYLKGFKRRGGVVTTSARVTGLTRTGAHWSVRAGDRIIHSKIVVNAAGAWASELGRMAGAQEIGMQPMRRTAALIEAPKGVAIERWPLVLDVEEQVYFKPDAGLLMVSPADETPSDPCDAQPEDIDIAIAIDRFQAITTLEVRRVKSRWAGLRCFVPDRSPVVGFDLLQPGFFWLAALGGYGVQTAPAVSDLAARLLLEGVRSEAFEQVGVRPEDITPARFDRTVASVRGN